MNLRFIINNYNNYSNVINIIVHISVKPALYLVVSSQFHNEVPEEPLGLKVVSDEVFSFDISQFQLKQH